MSVWSIIRVTKVEEYLIEHDDFVDPMSEVSFYADDYDEAELVKVMSDHEEVKRIIHHFDKDKIYSLED